jgi:predicted Fe-S protein YdhL (DUF1289 family)
LLSLTGAPVANVVEAPDADNVLDVQVRQFAIKTLAARALSISAMVENVPSPCVNVCRMDTGSGLCEGCFRTIDDIRDWSRTDDAGKKAIWAVVTERLRQTHPDAFASA